MDTTIKRIANFIAYLHNTITGPWHYAKNVAAFNEYVSSELFKAREIKFNYETSFSKFLELDFDHYYKSAFNKYWFEIIFKPMSIKPKNIVLFAVFVGVLLKREENVK